MKSWMIGVLVGVLALGGIGVWMVSSDQESEAPEGLDGAPASSSTEDLPSFDRPAGEARLADPTPLTPATGSMADPAPDGTSAAADVGEAESEDLTFTGRVVDDAGRPIEGASVLYVAEPLSLQMQLRENSTALSKLPATRTDRNGRFELPARVTLDDDDDDFPDGMRFELNTPHLVVRHDSFATFTQGLTELAGPTRDVGELVLEPGAWISGRAIDSDGHPVSGAQASANNEEEGRGSRGPFFGRRLAEAIDGSSTTSDGRFMVRGLHPGLASLTVLKPGLRAAAREELELPPRAGLDVGDVTLEKGASIAGMVLNEKGEPLVGAEVSVSSMSRLVVNRIEDLPRQQLRQELGQRARTDDSGQFELTGLAGGTYTVHVSADGCDRLSKPDVPAGTRDLRLEPAVLGGLLVRLTSAEGGAPVSDAKLSASVRQTERFPFMVRGDTELEVLAGAEALAAAGKSGDPAGVYFLPHAGLEGTDLVVAAMGFATTALEAPGAPSGGIAEYAAALAPESVVAGLVADPDGKPVARARVRLRAEDGEDSGFSFRSGPGRRDGEFRRSIRIGDDDRTSATRHSAVSGTDGRFELRGVAAGEWELSTRAQGYVRGEPLALTLEAGKSQQDLQVVLEPAGSIAGLVTEPDGSPVAGAEVSVQPLTSAAPQDLSNDPVEQQLSRMGARFGGGGGPDTRRARTDVHGEYRIGDVAPGEYTVRLSEGPRGTFGGGAFVLAFDGDEPQDAPGTYARVEAGQELRVDFQRPERARLTGRIVAGGLPAPDVEVHLGQAGQFSFLGGGRTATTDARGNYGFEDITAGNYEVWATAPGAALEKRLPVELAAGQTRSLDLDFEGSTLSGKVVEDGSDKPAAGVTITVAPVVETGDNELQSTFERVEMVMVDAGGGGASGTSVTIGGGPANLVRTDEHGRFEVRYLEPGQYRVEAGGAGYVRVAPEQVEVHDGENRDDLVLHVQRGAVLTGVVRDSKTGLKLDKVPVRLEKENSAEMTLTADGVYRFDGLEPGAYTVSVMGSGFMSEPLASEPITLESGQQATLDLKTEPSEG